MIHHLHKTACPQPTTFLNPLPLMVKSMRRLSIPTCFSVIQEQHATAPAQRDAVSNTVLACPCIRVAISKSSSLRALSPNSSQRLVVPHRQQFLVRLPQLCALPSHPFLRWHWLFTMAVFTLRLFNTATSHSHSNSAMTGYALPGQNLPSCRSPAMIRWQLTRPY